jgi:hypothetical protein
MVKCLVKSAHRPFAGPRTALPRPPGFTPSPNCLPFLSLLHSCRSRSEKLCANLASSIICALFARSFAPRSFKLFRNRFLFITFPTLAKTIGGSIGPAGRNFILALSPHSFSDKSNHCHSYKKIPGVGYTNRSPSLTELLLRSFVPVWEQQPRRTLSACLAVPGGPLCVGLALATALAPGRLSA